PTRTPGCIVNLDTEAQTVTSGVVAALAVKTLHASLAPDALARAISVSVPANSQDLIIHCEASTSTGAAACANAFAAAYLRHRSAAASSVIQQQIASLNSRIRSLQQTAAALGTTVTSLPANSSQGETAQAGLTAVRSQLNSLNGKVATLDSEAAQTNGGSIITPATPSSKPVSPEKSVVVPNGISAGLILGLIGAFWWDRRAKRSA